MIAPRSTPTRSTSLLLAAAALAAAGACGDDARPTAVRVRVTYEVDWELDAFRIRAIDREKPAEVASTLTVLVPEEWAGQTVPLHLWGMRGDRTAAYAGGEVVPERGRQVTLDLVMTAVPCGEWCTPGATRCDGDGVAVCRERDVDECLEWSPAEPCSAEAPFCSIGECRAGCVDECAAGETRCEGPGQVRACGEADSDSCLDWLPPEPCDSGETCTGGACRATCESECALGDALCVGNQSVTCGDRDADGCLEWGPPAPCGQGGVCDQGACAESCTDDCEVATCTGLLYRACGQYDFDECTDASPGTSCVPADRCLEGLCTSEGCRSEERTCDEPPPSECIGADTLRVYDGAGSCVAGGVCEYEARDVECPDCPDCDLCEGVVCDSPPTPTCLDDRTLRTFSGGSCEDGACRYESTDIPCARGCSDDECGVVVDAGGEHSCAVRGDGTLECWGRDVDGESSPPDGTFTTISAGTRHTCAIRTDGTVTCWGDNAAGQLGPVSGTFVAVSAGSLHTCALKVDGSVTCWGSNESGRSTPPAGIRFVSISAGSAHTCGLAMNGEAHCWGSNSFNQASPPTYSMRSLSAGGNHTCFISGNDTLDCRGLNDDMQSFPPVGAYSSLSAGGFHSCALERDTGAVKCWGRDDYEQSSVSGGNFTLVTAGTSHNCAVAINGLVICWGRNDDGQSTAPDDLARP